MSRVALDPGGPLFRRTDVETDVWQSSCGMRTQRWADDDPSELAVQLADRVVRDAFAVSLQLAAIRQQLQPGVAQHLDAAVEHLDDCVRAAREFAFQRTRPGADLSGYDPVELVARVGPHLALAADALDLLGPASAAPRGTGMSED